MKFFRRSDPSLTASSTRINPRKTGGNCDATGRRDAGSRPNWRLGVNQLEELKRLLDEDPAILSDPRQGRFSWLKLPRGDAPP